MADDYCAATMFQPYKLWISLDIGDTSRKVTNVHIDCEDMDVADLEELVRANWPILLRQDGEHGEFDLFKVDEDARNDVERWEFIQRHREMTTLHADQKLDPFTPLITVYPTPPDRLGLNIIARTQGESGTL
jgi:hypothetical protein